MTALISEDAARFGGCCVCLPGCGGENPRGTQPACSDDCQWCFHACPERIATDCRCLLEYEALRHKVRRAS